MPCFFPPPVRPFFLFSSLAVSVALICLACFGGRVFRIRNLLGFLFLMQYADYDFCLVAIVSVRLRYADFEFAILFVDYDRISTKTYSKNLASMEKLRISMFVTILRITWYALRSER